MRTRPLPIAIAALATLLVVSGTGIPAPPAATAADHGPLFFGAYAKPLNGRSERQAVEDLEAATGRQMDTVREYLVWNESFPTNYHEWLADTGRVPIISLKAKHLNGLADGQPAPGCRIAYPSFHTTPNAYTDVGWQVFDDTVSWAIGGCAAP